jgi:hypothetical protein
MSRPRIRTIKPETWADEKIGTLSRDARLLFVGLITMADDAGRLRGMPAAILGHAFPYDQDAPSLLERWLAEVERTGLIVRYDVDGHPYVALTGWAKHQKINRPTASELPGPPDPGVLTESSVTTQGAVTEASRNDHDLARGRAQADRIGSDQDQDLSPNGAGRAREGEIDFDPQHLPGPKRMP